MWKDETTWGKETILGFEFSISREDHEQNGIAENKISLLCWKRKWKYSTPPPNPFVFFVNILITSIFNWTLWSFWQGRGIYPSMRRFCDNLVVILFGVCVCVIWLWWFKNHLKTPNFLAYAWGSKGSEPCIRPLYCPSSRSPNPVPACQGDGASWRGFLAQLPHLYPGQVSLLLWEKKQQYQNIFASFFHPGKGAWLTPLVVHISTLCAFYLRRFWRSGLRMYFRLTEEKMKESGKAVYCRQRWHHKLLRLFFTGVFEMHFKPQNLLQCVFKRQ